MTRPGDHVRSELESHDSGGDTSEEGRSPSRPRSKLQNAAARRSPRRPKPERLIATIRQLLIVERKDVTVVAADLFGGRRVMTSNPPHKLRHRLQRPLWLLSMRRMSAIRDGDRLHRPARLAFDRLDLLPGAVLVALSLEDENGDLDRGQVLFDVPGAKIRMEPGTVPALEGDVHVRSVVPRQTVAQVRSPVVLADLRDARETVKLGVYVRRLQNQPFQARARLAAGVDQ